MVASKFQLERITGARASDQHVPNFSLSSCMSNTSDSTSDLWELKLWYLWVGPIITIFAFHDIFLDRFFNPHPTHLSMTVSVDGSGLMTNLTPRKSLMCRSVSIPFGESFPTRIFETSCGHNAQRRNNRPCKPNLSSDY